MAGSEYGPTPVGSVKLLSRLLQVAGPGPTPARSSPASPSLCSGILLLRNLRQFTEHKPRTEVGLVVVLQWIP